MYPEEEWLALSGIQHYGFCRRQWALIHIEQQWKENVLTIEGGLMHERAHDEALREKRGSTLVLRALPVHSAVLGLIGQCDVVEFRQDPSGHPLSGEEGLWMPFPVEYKRGRMKICDEDRLQVCAQAMCLEEMFGVEVTHGSLFYGETRSREDVTFGPSLRSAVKEASDEMHDLYRRKHTPKAKRTKGCDSCSIKNVCLSRLPKRETVSGYISNRLKEA